MRTGRPRLYTACETCGVERKPGARDRFVAGRCALCYNYWHSHNGVERTAVLRKRASRIAQQEELARIRTMPDLCPVCGKLKKKQNRVRPGRYPCPTCRQFKWRNGYNRPPYIYLSGRAT